MTDSDRKAINALEAVKALKGGKALSD